jgi:hypothetical protein
MRIERALLALLLALAARGGAAVLAQAGPLALALAGPDSVTQTSLPFHLSAPARVWAEAAGLSGLESGRSGEAPEAFLDEQYLGPLLAEHHGSWRSPEALALDAGDHVLLLRCSSVGIPRPCGITALRVVSDAPGPTALARPGAAKTPPDCGRLVLSRRWPPRYHGQSLVLSVLSGRSQSAGVMARLLPGQAWACQLRLPAPNGRALPLVAHFTASPSGQGCLLLSLDQDFHGPVDALGYRPDHWEPLRISLCQGRLHVALAQAPPFDLNCAAPSLDLELAAQDVELGLKPAEP